MCAGRIQKAASGITSDAEKGVDSAVLWRGAGGAAGKGEYSQESSKRAFHGLPEGAGQAVGACV